MEKDEVKDHSDCSRCYFLQFASSKSSRDFTPGSLYIFLWVRNLLRYIQFKCEPLG